MYGLIVRYGSTGDPAKNVSVANWPVSTDVVVWFDETVVGPWGSRSEVYNASGFNTLHILMKAKGLSGSEELTIKVYGYIWNPTHTIGSFMTVYSVGLTQPSWTHSITIPVPSETFQFHASAGEGTTCDLDLGFYLTWG